MPNRDFWLLTAANFVCLVLIYNFPLLVWPAGISILIVVYRNDGGRFHTATNPPLEYNLPISRFIIYNQATKRFHIESNATFQEDGTSEKERLGKFVNMVIDRTRDNEFMKKIRRIDRIAMLNAFAEVYVVMVDIPKLNIGCSYTKEEAKNSTDLTLLVRSVLFSYTPPSS